RSEEVGLSRAVHLYIGKIERNEVEHPDFNGFYEFVRDEYIQTLNRENVEKEDFNIGNFLHCLKPYYQGGEYDYLLNSPKQIDLLSKRFVVFELDNIKDHPILFPVVTIIIMETFINKMRHLDGVRKMILIEEAWKAIAKEGMADYIKYLFKTVRKFFGEAVVVTQEADDIISSPIVKETVITNADCKILLDQSKYMNKFEEIQNVLGLTEKQRSQVLSINKDLDPNRKYKEVFIGLGSEGAVYATEVSTEEYLAYTTEQSEKLEVLDMAAKKGDIELAIKELADRSREKRKSK
ncbi:MAG: TraG family conjugative transposon ATPase, partial [Bacteroidales bacterium]|nr:TraG family conjugative transposon ATPase [Bacteroidales bacterium]